MLRFCHGLEFQNLLYERENEKKYRFYAPLFCFPFWHDPLSMQNTRDAQFGCYQKWRTGRPDLARPVRISSRASAFEKAIGMITGDRTAAMQRAAATVKRRQEAKPWTSETRGRRLTSRFQRRR